MTATEPALVELEANPAPGPGSRTSRTAGQVGGALVLLDLVVAFGWFGADTWTERQAMTATAAAVFLLAALQNGFNWWRNERQQAEAVTVTAVDGDTRPTERKGGMQPPKPPPPPVSQTEPPPAPPPSRRRT